MQFKRFYDLASKSVAAWSDDYAPSMGAALAYYTLFSMAPLLLIVPVQMLAWHTAGLKGIDLAKRIFDDFDRVLKSKI